MLHLDRHLTLSSITNKATVVSKNKEDEQFCLYACMLAKEVRDHSQTLIRGAWGLMQMKNHCKNLCVPPTSKKFQGPPFGMKIMGQPNPQTSMQSQFPQENLWFFQPPYKGPNFEGPPFLHQAFPQVFMNSHLVCTKSLSVYPCLSQLALPQAWVLLW